MEQQRAQRSLGVAVARYTALRAALFLPVFLLVLLLLGEPLVALGAGVLGSALLGVPLLAGPRRELSEAVAARAERRQEQERRRRERLDQG